MGYRLRKFGWWNRFTIHEFFCGIFRRSEKKGYHVTGLLIKGEKIALVRHNKCGRWWIR